MCDGCLVFFIVMFFVFFDVMCLIWVLLLVLVLVGNFEVCLVMDVGVFVLFFGLINKECIVVVWLVVGEIL